MTSTSYTVMRENFQADTWDHVARIQASNPEQAIRWLAMHGDDFKNGTYVAVSDDEWTQFMEARPRVVISTHIETLEPTAQP